jgi:hypothetical protein
LAARYLADFWRLKMKIIRLGLAALLFAGIACAEEFDLMDYSPKTETVWIKTSTGQTKRSFESFSAEDQQKITGLLADREFKSGLSVDMEKKEDPRKTAQGEIKDTTYTIGLKNQTEAALGNVEITYQIFYERRDGKTEEKVRQTGVYRANLSPGETKTFETPIVPIRNERRLGSGGGGNFTYTTPTTSFTDPGGGMHTFGGETRTASGGGGAPTVYIRDRLIGMYLCVSRKDLNGKIIKHEYEEGVVPDEDARKNYREKMTEKNIEEKRALLQRKKTASGQTPGNPRLNSKK